MKFSFLPIVISLMMLVSLKVEGQDMHFSQFSQSPLYLNPANTGLFGGDVRISGNLREQWRSIPVDYKAFNIGVDTKLQTSGLNHFGIGVTGYKERAGDLGYFNAGVGASLAYNMFMFKSKSRRGGDFYLSFGFAGSRNWQGFNDTNIRLENPNDVLDLSNRISYWDMTFGGMGIYVTSEAIFSLGYSFSHINAANVSFKENRFLELNKKHNIHGSMILTPRKWKQTFLLQFLYTRQLHHQELLLGGMVKFQQFSGKRRAALKNWVLNLGGYYRWNDAPILVVQLDFKNQFSLGFSLDLTTSKAIEANNAQGAFEISIAYIIKGKQSKKDAFREGGIYLSSKNKCPSNGAGPWYDNPFYQQKGLNF